LIDKWKAFPFKRGSIYVHFSFGRTGEVILENNKKAESDRLYGKIRSPAILLPILSLYFISILYMFTACQWLIAVTKFCQ